jgi:ADP-ribose pyrophosphatase
MTNFGKKLNWELLNEEHVVQDQWIDFRRNTYKLPDGQTISPVYNYSKHSFSLVVATDTDGNFICVRQYRHGINDIATEFPAGGIEYDKKEESNLSSDCTEQESDNSCKTCITKDNIIASEDEAFEAAKRELREETGYTSDNWTHLLTIPANATISNSNVHIYCATDCVKTATQELDATEFLNVVKLSETELLSSIFGGDFKQALHVLAYYLFKDKCKK